MTDNFPRGRSRWSRTVDERFVPSPLAPAEERPRGQRSGGLAGIEAILVVEDQDPIREAARTILERLGYRVEVATSGDEALRLVRSGAAVDLLLTDVVLPGMNGIALAERVQEERADVRVVFMSGYVSAEGMPERAVRRGLFAFLQKPFNRDALARAVRELLDRDI